MKVLMLNHRIERHKPGEGVERRGKWMALKHKRWTYMGDQHHSFLWTQWTSETMYLWDRNRGGVAEWMDGGMEGEKDKTIKTK